MKTDPFKLQGIPPMSQLLKISNELSGKNRIQEGYHYVDFQYDTLLYEDIQNLQALHKISDIKDAVDQEMAWFNTTGLKPRNAEPPSVDSIQRFQNLIWDSPATRNVTNYNMLPGTIAGKLF